MEENMINTSIELVSHEAFNKSINIALFNDIVHFVLLVSDMTPEDKTKAQYELSDRIIWFCDTNETDFQEKYQFRYFGEMLERYEARFGNDPRDLRAIALALGYTQTLLTTNMFVGSQQKDFIKEVRACADDDIYLNGALYLIDMAQKKTSTWLTEREVKPFDKTEELLFFLSLYPDIETGYTQMKAALVRLLGTDRTIPVIQNIGLYCWFIWRLHEIIKADRKKDAALFKALTALPTAFVKEGSTQNNALVTHGYTKKEIAYANYAVLHYRTVRYSLQEHSMITERIAVAFCKAIIADPGPQTNDTYELMISALIKYKKFPIKCDGFQKIWDAVEEGGSCKCPLTFVRLTNIVIWSDIFRFNILDKKWDILASDLSKERYQLFFDRQLIHDAEHLTLDQSEIQARIDVYERLTGVAYIQTFDCERSCRSDNFSLLVKNKIASLEDLFVQCVGGIYGKGMIECIWSFIVGIQDLESFEFFCRLFSNYEQHDIAEAFGKSYSSNFHSELYQRSRTNSYYCDSKGISVKRDFLTPDENRMILDWLDIWVYLYRTDDYVDFIICVMKDVFATSLLPQGELRRLYDIIITEAESELNVHDVRALKKSFLTEEELQADAETELKKEKEQALLQKETEKKEVLDKFEDLFDGTYESAIKFLDGYQFYWDKRQHAHQFVKESFDRICKTAGCVLTGKELSHFFKVCQVLASTDHFCLSQAKTYIQTIEEEEEEGVDV